MKEKFEMEEMPQEEKAEVKEKRVKIIVEEQEGDENQSRVFVSVNGRGSFITRGFEVEVPESVVEVLKNAIATKMYQNVETGDMILKDVPRINFRVLKI